MVDMRDLKSLYYRFKSYSGYSLIELCPRDPMSTRLSRLLRRERPAINPHSPLDCRASGPANLFSAPREAQAARGNIYPPALNFSAPGPPRRGPGWAAWGAPNSLAVRAMSRIKLNNAELD
jgi:hypothetical protein